MFVRRNTTERAATRPAAIRIGVAVGLLVGAIGIGTSHVLDARVAGGAVTEVQVTGKAGIPSDASAVAVNLAAVGPAGDGFISAFPCGAAVPNAATVNHDSRPATSNSAIVKIGSGGKICLYTLTDSDIIVDVTGWFPAGADYTAIDPTRFLDTRTTQRAAARTTREVQITGRAGVPPNASAVAVNLAAVGPAGDGFISAFPCGAAVPNAATVNHDSRPATSNSAIVKIGSGGKICLYTLTDSDIIVDVTGWFPAGADYTAIDPTRFLDTRTTQRAAARTTREVQITGRAGVPPNASAVAVNLAAVGPAGDGFISAFPCGAAVPNAATVNHDSRPATSNSAIVKIGSGGKICLYTLTDSDIIVDVTGWFPAGADYTAIDPTRFLDTRATAAPSTAGAVFAETFDGNRGLERFEHGVWHRDPHLVDQTQWGGDHDMNCGSPDTQRTIHRSAPNESFYLCKDHMMSSVGDTSGYSVAWFSPNQAFGSVRSVSFDVNLTDLGPRQWWKVGVVSAARYNSTIASGYDGQRTPGFLVSDVGSSDLPSDLATSDLFAASWSGQASAGWPGGLMKIGNTGTSTGSNPTPTDKATRHPVSLVDNTNGTVTFTVAGVSVTRAGSFPACPCRVVFYDHKYTPNKMDGGPPRGYTWHWDNIIVR